MLNLTRPHSNFKTSSFWDNEGAYQLQAKESRQKKKKTSKTQVMQNRFILFSIKEIEAIWIHPLP